MPPLSLALLGPIHATLDRQPITPFNYDKVTALLVYLAVEAGRAHEREALMGLFWPDLPEEAARNNLRQALVKLRDALGDRRADPPFLLTCRATLQFNRASQYQLDVVTFTALLDACDCHAHRHPESCKTCAQQVQQAVELYQGPFLAEFFLPDSAPFEEWALIKREALHRRMVDALGRLVRYHERRTHYPLALVYAQRQLTLEPWAEETHRQLMRLHFLNGDRNAALAQYESCCRILAAELDVTPEAETVKLYTQLRNADAQTPLALERHGLPTTRPHTLPVQLTPFIGREADLAQLSQLLDRPECRLLTITGPGGIGKTRLALQVAADHVDDFADGLFFVPLVELTVTHSLPHAILAALGIPLRAQQPADEQLRAFLQKRELLLVLDNYEQLLPDVNLLLEILRAAPGTVLLVTSHERLALQAEWHFALDGLSYPPVRADKQVDKYESVELFIQHALQTQSSFNPTEAEHQAVQRICQLVEGMPLGIELAAAWVQLLSCQEIAQEIEGNLDFLTSNRRDLPERQRGLRAVFDHSWKLLTDEEQRVMRQLSVFRGFTREAAATVAGASLSILSRLSHKSFIQVHSNRRYEIHELLRQFALDTLAEQLAGIRDAHSAYYCAFLAQREVDLKGARQQAAMAEIEADGENVRSAWQWAIEREQIKQMTQALDSVGLFYLWQSRLYEGEAMCRLAIERLGLTFSGGTLSNGNCDLQTTPVHPDLARFGIRALIWLSIFQRHLNQTESAQHALRQAQLWLVHPSLAGLDTRSEHAQLRLEEAEVIFRTNYEEASTLAEQSLRILRTVNDPWHLAQALDLWGRTFQGMGLLERPREATRNGLTLRQNLGDARGMASSLNNLSHIARWMGRFEEAEELIRQSIAIFAELNDRGQQASAIHTLAGTLVFGGQFAQSLPLFEESLSIHHALGLPGEPVGSAIVSGFALMHLGRYEEALPFHQRALSLYGKEIGYPVKDLGRTALVKGSYAEAQQYLQEALALFHNEGDMNGLGQTLGCLGYLALRQHNLQQARAYIRENLQLAAETRIFLPSMTALSGVALLYVEEGDYEAAIELYTVALQNGHVANSRWYYEVVGQQIDTVAQTLPAAAVEAAQARDTAGVAIYRAGSVSRVGRNDATL